MKSEKFTLNWYDAYKGAQMYVITMLVMSIGGVVMTAGFDVFTADWVEIFKNAINVSIVSTFSYIIKNYLTDRNGVL